MEVNEDLRKQFSFCFSTEAANTTSHPGESDSSSSDTNRSSSSSSDTNRSSSSSSETNGSSSTSSAVSEHGLKRLRNKLRTEKARAQRRINAALRREKKKNPPAVGSGHPASCYTPHLQPDCNLIEPGSFSRPARFTRLRLLWSWFSSFVCNIVGFLKAETEKGEFNHAINVCIIDDTNVRLTAKYDETGSWRSSRVVSVMNNLQQVILNSASNTKHYVLHTPMLPLERSNTAGLAHEFCSWIFCWLGQIGERFHSFSPIDVDCSKMPIQSLVIVWDSLRTNMSVLKGLRVRVHTATEEQRSFGKPQAFPLLSVQCGIHQVALCRKQLLFWFQGHWSSIVRLAHLFEVHAFRSKFRDALVRVICSSFRYVAVSQLPTDFAAWKEESDRRTNAFATNYPSRRKQLHRHLARFDNGDVSSDEFCHWCQGDCCRGQTSQEKRRHCLIQLCRGYILLFGTGFPVPLTYRWIHAARALQYCRVSWLHDDFKRIF